jgi:glutamate-1-semialdehyde 2,1-aminomutase
MVSARGARVRFADGSERLDWTMALGAVGLGYAHPHVVEAVSRAVRDGSVGPLPPTLEVRVAERLAAAYPAAEQVRFLKTGAEGVAAAVRLARVATGREHVVHCGYHGWLDGPTSGTGVPGAVAALWHPAPFDDPHALVDLVRRLRPAALVLEPVVERAPSLDWLRAARAVTDEAGTVLVFDEVKTAFRLALGGAAEYWNVHPDLAVLGKALANGFPLAAVVGRADLMARVRETWISSTLAAESAALAAADAVLDVWAREDVAGHLERIGRGALEGLGAARLPGVEVVGEPVMWFLRFDDAEVERAVLARCRAAGVLLKRGAYNFPSLAHTEADVALTVGVVRAALEEAA